MSPLPLVPVSAGILRDATGRVLIAQRPPGKHMGGWWEFPGGKAAESESGTQALARELFEELGVRIGPCHRLLQLRHDYTDRSVVLDVYIVADYAGEPQSLEGQALKWIAPEALGAERLLPADRPIVEALLRALRLRAAREATGQHPTAVILGGLPATVRGDV
ncbi:MAG TPA: (deoxy)nucleoside triphosphate pyrophosphohydrolase [Steroidobacteraceae bacterium]|jgi:8-oxo-dGTP diphosphatase|nr:(deoxy)nucleoside triphosphate pyrophosphohydrolase [Steroidobacteraceae bacterium]